MEATTTLYKTAVYDSGMPDETASPWYATDANGKPMVTPDNSLFEAFAILLDGLGGGVGDGTHCTGALVKFPGDTSGIGW